MVDFTTLHPFDFDRNLFNFLTIVLVIEHFINKIHKSISSTGGADYQPVSRDLVFDEDTSEFMLRAIIIDDELLEPTERFELQLATSDQDVMLNPDVANVNILDNDREWYSSINNV